MTTKAFRALCRVAAMSAPALPAAADVAVQFVYPEHYADAGDHGVRSQRNLKFHQAAPAGLGRFAACRPATHWTSDSPTSTWRADTSGGAPVRTTCASCVLSPGRGRTSSTSGRTNRARCSSSSGSAFPTWTTCLAVPLSAPTAIRWSTTRPCSASGLNDDSVRDTVADTHERTRSHPAQPSESAPC